MKKLSISFVLFLTLAAFAIPGCEKEKTVPLRGDVIGYVKLLDERGNPQRDHSNATVTLGENIATSTTDASGKFEMNDVPIGTYTLKFEHEGYGTFKQFNKILTGGNEPAVVTDILLVQVPVVTASDIKVTSNDGSISATGNLSSAGGFYSVTLYVNDSSNVSNERYDFQGSSQYCCGNVNNPFRTTVYPYYPQNTKLYVAVYASPQAAVNGNYSYYDYTTNLWVDPTGKKLSDPIAVTW